jgi:WD40 repeat protein
MTACPLAAISWRALVFAAALPVFTSQSVPPSSPPQDAPISVAVTADGRLRATGGWDRLARIWRTSDGALLRTYRFKDPVFAVAFSPDGRLLATGTAKAGEDAVKLWRVSDGKCIRTYRDTSSIGVSGITFSADGRRLLVIDGAWWNQKRLRVPRVRGD